MDFNPEAISAKDVYKLMTGCVVPRPIAWVSTVDENGSPNLAPFSYFTPVCSKPPTLLFCPAVRGTDGQQKDTLNNIRATGEFVVNVVTESLVEAMNTTATELPAEVNEFELAGVTAAPSALVRPPRVAESPVQFECRLNQIVTISDQKGGGNIVIGTVVHIHVDDSIWREGNYIDLEAYRPVGRMMGSTYTRITELFTVDRPPSKVKPKSE